MVRVRIFIAFMVDLAPGASHRWREPSAQLMRQLILVQGSFK